MEFRVNDKEYDIERLGPFSWSMILDNLKIEITNNIKPFIAYSNSYDDDEFAYYVKTYIDFFESKNQKNHSVKILFESNNVEKNKLKKLDECENIKEIILKELNELNEDTYIYSSSLCEIKIYRINNIENN